MIDSAIIKRASEYLSFRKINAEAYERSIVNAIGKLNELNSFHYVYKEFGAPLPFLLNEPYCSFLNGCNGYYLVAATLGYETDEIIRELSEKSDSESAVFDSVANAYLECKAESFEITEFGDDISYRFGPGYQGSPIEDIKYIINELEDININFSPSGMITPQKSIVGLIGKGKSPEKKCGKCIMLKDCLYRREGKVCFSLEKR